MSKAEEQKSEIAKVVLNKEKILAFREKHGAFGEDNFKIILEVIDKIAEDEGYFSLCCAQYYFIKNKVSVSGLKPPEDGSLLSEFVLVPALIANSAEFCEDTSMQRNIKAYLKTGKEFKDFGGFISLEKLDKMIKSFY